MRGPPRLADDVFKEETMTDAEFRGSCQKSMTERRGQAMIQPGWRISEKSISSFQSAPLYLLASSSVSAVTLQSSIM